ncbi:MAG TPA: hypothetical protein VNU44_23585, partial [Bryobacteraceae bacterium]|nr:hypothetical protein [Bryobacteraceae bacterium]
MLNRFLTSFLALIVCFSASGPCRAQSPSGQTPAAANTAPDPPPDPERWNIFYQATSIGQYHGTFPSPYAGPYSLQNYTERDVSLTTT